MNGIARAAEQSAMHPRRVNFRTQPPMYKPFLIPDGFQRARRHFTQQRRDVWSTKSTKAGLRRIVVVRIAVVEGRAGAGDYEERLKVSLKQDVHVHPLPDIATAPYVTRDGIEYVARLSRAALHCEPRREVCHVVDAGHRGPDLLVDLVRAEIAVLIEKLRDERSVEIAWRPTAKK